MSGGSPTSRYSYLSHLCCSRCEKEYDAAKLVNTCECGAPLLAQYDIPSIAEVLSPKVLRSRPETLWRYHELLPVASSEAIVTLGEAMSPLLELGRLGDEMRLPGLTLKEESSLPTGTFKSRGAAVGVSRAKELGAPGIAMPTNGNAGAAWAAYAARAGLAALVVMPEDAPEITRRECLISGADLRVIPGTIKDAGAEVQRAIADGGFFDVSTLKEPYRLEGKKTLALEIVEQLGWIPPDVIVYPTGGGVGLIGIYKALRELQALGWIGGRLPKLVSAQASGCAPIVTAFEAGRTESSLWPDPQTVAFGISVPKALGDFLILKAIRETGGTAVAVTDAELLEAQGKLARLEGVFCCPEGGAALAAVGKLRSSGWLAEEERVVVINTGTGLKYPNTVSLDE